MFLYNPFGYFSFCHNRFQITVKRISTRNKNPVPYHPQGLMQLMKTGMNIIEHTHQFEIRFRCNENCSYISFKKTKIDFIIVADITP